MVRPPRCVGTVATTRKLSGESSCTKVIVPSPLELTAKPRLGSNAAPSTPLPIGNVTSTLPRSGSTTAINPLEHTAETQSRLHLVCRPVRETKQLTPTHHSVPLAAPPQLATT